MQLKIKTGSKSLIETKTSKTKKKCIKLSEIISKT